MYDFHNNNNSGLKEILYSAQKNSKKKYNYKNYTSELNNKNTPFSKEKKSNKYQAQSSLNSNNINNIELNYKKLNSDYSPFKKNNYIFNINSKNSKKRMFLNQDINNEQNSFIFKKYINIKDKSNEKFKNIYNSSGKQQKNLVRNLSEEEQIKKNRNLNYNEQKKSLRKDSSFVNKIIYNKNNNIFNEIPDNFKKQVQYNYNKNKLNNKIYKDILSKSSFSNSINNIDNNNYTNNYNNYMISNQSNSSINDSMMNNSKFAKNQNSLKYIIPNKGKYKISTYSTNIVNNIKNDSISKKYSNKTEKILGKKQNNIQLRNNPNKNENNFTFKIKINSHTPVSNNNNCFFTNPNNKNLNNEYYMIKDSLIWENNNNSNFKLSLNGIRKEKKDDKSCPKFVKNYPNNNFTNINNINNNNNYIVNVNKYINIINKKHKIIKKSSNNGNNIRNYNSYKIINNSNNNNKKNSIDKNIKNNIKNNNYMNSPNDLYFNKYTNKKSNNLPSTNIKEKNNLSNVNNNVSKNNLKKNIQTDNYKFNKNVEFKKLKTHNYINRNNLKNVNFYQNENIYLNQKPRRKLESDLKKSIIDSNSFKYINKSNTNSSLKKGINNIIQYYKNNNYNQNKHKNKNYNESLSSSTKNLNTSQRRISHNKNNYNENVNNIARNSNYKKERNDKYNLAAIFKPESLGQKLDFQLNNLNKINSNRNPKIKVEDKNINANTIILIDKKKDNIKYKNTEYLNANIKNNFKLIKLMKTVKDYNNKNNKQRYDNNIKENKNNNLKQNIFKANNNNYITNVINKLNNDNKNIILMKQKIRDSYNPVFSQIANLKSFNENKVLQNINQNALIMYSIYIISYYFTDFHKIGLSKIVLLNENNEPIPVICSNNNCGKDSNKLFDISTTNKDKSSNKPFITEFKNNIYINFYINNIQSNHIKYIHIKNYTDLKNKISPVGKIEIFQAKKLIFKGILNSNKISNIVLSNIKKEIYENNIKDIPGQNNIKEINININNNRPNSLSKYRSMEDENNQNETNDLIINKEYDNFYTTRGTIYNGYSNLMNNNKNDIENYDENNYEDNLLSNDDNNEEKEFNINLNSLKNNNDFDLDSLLSVEFNKTTNNNINSHNNKLKSNNKLIKDKYEKYNTNNNTINKLSYSNSNNNINQNSNTIKNNNNVNTAFFNLFRKTYNKNEIEDFAQIFKTSICKMREYSSSFNLKNSSKNNTLKKRTKINNDINLNLSPYNQEDESFSNINLNNENIENFDNNNLYNNMYNHIKTPNYIEFNKIRFIISSNYGHNKYVGLTGLELFNVKGEAINIETALTIGALPKDLRTLYNDEKENRIFENVFNKINNTNDSDNMWVTKLKKNNPLPFIELYFKEKLRVSKIRIYNYNERNKLNIGAKTIELYLDDEYYNTIYLKPGIGEIASGFIAIKNKKAKKENELAFDLDDSDMNTNEDFGQDITFPLIDITQNDLNDLYPSKFYYTSLNANINYSKNNIISDNNNTSNKNQIKFASFLYKQSYETPYLPCGYYLKLVFSSNYYKGTVQLAENDLKYSDIGLNKIEIFDDNGKNIINNSNDSDNSINYKIISNCEILKDEDEEEKNINNKIIINGGDIGQNENGNNCIFYIFDKPIRVSYIKFYPLEEDNKPILNSVKEIKIFSDCKIIFEGVLYLDKPTIVLFTCERKILDNINEDYLTKEINKRSFEEEKNENFISLILN